MQTRMLVAAVVGLAAIAMHSTARADAVTDCAKLEGKALGAAFEATLKEAARACGKGSAGNPFTISQAAAGAAAGKFFAAVGKAVDKHGPGACAVTLDTIGEGAGFSLFTILQNMRTFADAACQVAP